MNQIARQVFVLHKSDGHVRFALPARFANAGSAGVIESALLRVPGVRLASLDRRSAKLSVHYDPLACTLRQLALVLNGSLVAALDAAGPAGAQQPASGVVPADLGRQVAAGLRALESAGRKFLKQVQAQLSPSDSSATGTAPSGTGRQLAPLRRAFNPSLLNDRAVINFLNDIVAFYLIRVHWNLITQHWIKAPLKHGSAWLTVFYLTFLLVKYRKNSAAPTVLPAAGTEPSTS
jgi:hypothetical protein